MLNFEAINNETQLLSKDKNSIQSQISNRPLTMQYLGGKSRIVEEILCSIERAQRYSCEDSLVHKPRRLRGGTSRDLVV